VSIPSLPRVPDPLRRIRIPKDLSSVTTVAPEADPEQVGANRDGVERIWEAAETLYRTRVHPGIQVCVRRHGEVILDRAIGHARGNGPEDRRDTEKVLLTPETPMCIFSASKGVTAALVHLLDERGLLHIGDPVAHYLPEYARHDKGSITIGHILSHRGGVTAVPPEALDLDLANDWQLHRELFYESKPTHRPGKRQAYLAVAGGSLLGEVIREVTGKSVKEVLAEEILDPLGFEWTNYGVPEDRTDEVALNYPSGVVLIPPVSTLITRALGGVHPDTATEMSNDPRFLTAVMPAANVVSTANEMTRFYDLLRRGGELDGVRVMEERTIRRALVPQSHLEVDLALGFPIAFGYGFMLGGRFLSLFGTDTADAFGHLGWINIVTWADPARALSASVITTGKAPVYPEVARFWQLANRITREMSKVD
jgi:CubicO group peptidase (beta-lactamase class C family)